MRKSGAQPEQLQSRRRPPNHLPFSSSAPGNSRGLSSSVQCCRFGLGSFREKCAFFVSCIIIDFGIDIENLIA